MVWRNRRRGFWRWINVFHIGIFYNSWILRWSLRSRRKIHFRMILDGWPSRKLSIRIYRRRLNKASSRPRRISKRTVPVYSANRSQIDENLKWVNEHIKDLNIPENFEVVAPIHDANDPPQSRKQRTLFIQHQLTLSTLLRQPTNTLIL